MVFFINRTDTKGLTPEQIAKQEVIMEVSLKKWAITEGPRHPDSTSVGCKRVSVPVNLFDPSVESSTKKQAVTKEVNTPVSTKKQSKKESSKKQSAKKGISVIKDVLQNLKLKLPPIDTQLIARAASKIKHPHELSDANKKVSKQSSVAAVTYVNQLPVVNPTSSTWEMNYTYQDS